MSRKFVEAKLNEAVAPWGNLSILWEENVDPRELSAQRSEGVLEYAIEWRKTRLVLWALGSKDTDLDTIREVFNHVELTSRYGPGFSRREVSEADLLAALSSSNEVVTVFVERFKESLHENKVDPCRLFGRIPSVTFLDYICFNEDVMKNNVALARQALDTISSSEADVLSDEAHYLYRLVPYVCSSGQLEILIRLNPGMHMFVHAAKSKHFTLELLNVAKDLYYGATSFHHLLVKLNELKLPRAVKDEVQRNLDRRSVIKDYDDVDLLSLAGEARNARRAIKRNWNEEHVRRVLQGESRYRIYHEPLQRLYKERDRANIQEDDVQSMLIDKIIEHVETVSLNIAALKNDFED